MHGDRPDKRCTMRRYHRMLFDYRFEFARQSNRKRLLEQQITLAEPCHFQSRPPHLLESPEGPFPLRRTSPRPPLVLIEVEERYHMRNGMKPHVREAGFEARFHELVDQNLLLEHAIVPRRCQRRWMIRVARTRFGEEHDTVGREHALDFAQRTHRVWNMMKCVETTSLREGSLREWQELHIADHQPVRPAKAARAEPQHVE